jgi:hypothetical protein
MTKNKLFGIEKYENEKYRIAIPTIFPSWEMAELWREVMIKSDLERQLYRVTEVNVVEMPQFAQMINKELSERNTKLEGEITSNNDSRSKLKGLVKISLTNKKETSNVE